MQQKIQLKDINVVVSEIATAIYRKFTAKQLREVSLMVNGFFTYPDSDSTTVATDICDLLDIERRGNRAAIREVLNAAIG